MKLVKVDNVNRHKNSSKCIAYEYPTADKEINGAVVELSGRYPEEKRVVNLKCKEIFYILEGEGKVVIEDEINALSTGDVLLIEPGEKYYWNFKGKIFSVCTPAWNPEQHREVE